MLKLLFVFATQSEEFSLPKVRGCQLRSLICGVGKLNAAIHLSHAVNHFKPHAIINLGISGSPNRKTAILSIFQIHQFFEANTPTIMHSKKISFKYPASLHPLKALSTFDQPVHGDLTKKYQSHLVDMEGYALAKIASFYHIPFFCFKAVSDHCDALSSNTIRRILPLATHAFETRLESILNYVLNTYTNTLCTSDYYGGN